MKDVEQELREMFARRQIDVAGALPPSDRVVQRTRRRQAGVVLLTTIAVAALAVVPILGVKLGHGAQHPVVPGGRVTIGTGKNDGVPWTLALVHANAAHAHIRYGFFFEYRSRPIRVGDTVFDIFLQPGQVFGGGAGSGSSCGRNVDIGASTPAFMFGAVTADAARVEYHLTNGTVIQGQVFAMPDVLDAPAKAFVIIGPHTAVDGDSVAYDSSGNELGRERWNLPCQPTSNVTIATGKDEGVRWTLTLTHTNDGYGLWFGYPHVSERGGVSLRPGQIFGEGMGAGGPGGGAPPREIYGVVTADATRAEFELMDRTVIEAHVYQMPHVLDAPAKAFVLFVPNDVLIVAGDMVAYNSNGKELGREYTDFSPISLWPELISQATPDELAVMTNLQVAGAVAARYYQTHGQSFLGLDPKTASAISSAVKYNTSTTAVAGEVSLRVSGKDGLALASATPDGHVYSACFQSGPDPSAIGQNDPVDANSCSNDGWL